MVCDLNAGEFPTKEAASADVIVMLGVLETIVDVESFFTHLRFCKRDAMLRTAAAAGVDAVFLPPGTVDAFAPKVLRSAMGAHFRQPLFTGSWEELRALISRASLRVYLAAADCDLVYTQADFRSPLALIVGGEAGGAGSGVGRPRWP